MKKLLHVSHGCPDAVTRGDGTRRGRTAYARVLSTVLLAFSASAWAAQGGTPNPTTTFVQPATVTLNTIVGTTSTVSLLLADLTSQNLNVSSITVTGAQATDYHLSGPCLAPGSVITQKGGACGIVVTFTPGALGARPATINAVFGNAPAVNVPLNGTGISAVPPPPVINITSLPGNGIIDFGPRPVQTSNNTADFLMQISDTGGAVLMQADTIIGANSADFVFGGTPVRGAACPGLQLINNQNLPCNLGIIFTPTAIGTRTATLRITSNDPVRPTIDVQLTGVGTPAPAAPPPPPITSFTDVSGLWGATAEPGWALSISHHKFATLTVPGTDDLVAYWTTFDTTGQATWFVLKGGKWSDTLTYSGGSIHRFTGSPFTGPYLQSQLVDTIVGTGSLGFSDQNTGVLNFTVNGFSGTKPIVRNPFTF